MLLLANDNDRAMKKWQIALRLYLLPRKLLNWLQDRKIGCCEDCKMEGNLVHQFPTLLHRTPTMHMQRPNDMWMCRYHSENYIQIMESQWNDYLNMTR
jgi:hypothetical protein